MGPLMEALQMNKHIELVKKWLDKPESVSLEELKANKDAAKAAIAAKAAKADWDAVYGSDWAAYWAVRAAKAAEDATYWDAMAIYWRNLAIKYIEKYEELTQ